LLSFRVELLRVQVVQVADLQFASLHEDVIHGKNQVPDRRTGFRAER
jgi:hypothetical protein